MKIHCDMRKLFTLILILLPLLCIGQIAYHTDFKDSTELVKNWAYNAPWGTSNNKQGINHPAGIEITDDGLKMICLEDSIHGYLMPRIFWKKAPFGYGTYSAEMTVPNQDAICVFVLYSAVKYKLSIRSIMPEIDIVEHGTENKPDLCNHAVHEWVSNPYFDSIPDFTYETRHRFDYDLSTKKQKNSQSEWTGERKLFECKVSKWGVWIWVDKDLVFSRWGCIEANFTPTFGVSVPDWIESPEPSYMIVHNFKVEQ